MKKVIFLFLVNLFLLTQFCLSYDLFFFSKKDQLAEQWLQSEIIFYHQQIDLFNFRFEFQKQFLLTNIFINSGVKVFKSDFLQNDFLRQLDYDLFLNAKLFIDDFFYQIGFEINGGIDKIYSLAFNMMLEYQFQNFRFSQTIILNNSLFRNSFLDEKKLDLEYLTKLDYSLFKNNRQSNFKVGAYYRNTFLNENHFFGYFSLLWNSFKISFGYAVIRNLTELEIEFLDFIKTKSTFNIGFVSHPILGISSRLQMRCFFGN